VTAVLDELEESPVFLGLNELPTPPEPVALGPTWARNPTWQEGDGEYGKYVLPEHTLGWQVQAWVEGIDSHGIYAPANILSDDVDEHGNPLPFRFTAEQLRFVLWMYAIDDRGRFIYRDMVLQRLKGWGKDPLAAVIAAVEFVGPCRFMGWANRDMPELGLRKDDPIGKRHGRAWVQIAAVSKDQTKNTMTLFPGLFSPACILEHGIDIGKEVIYAYDGRCRIEAVTSSPKALEGGRPTLVIKNETHHWLDNNNGHEMSDVIDRNAVKAKDGAARTFSITNAYDPGQESVAQQERESWEEEVDSGWRITTMYDSLEAPKQALLRLPKVWIGQNEDGSKLYREPTEEEVRDYIGTMVKRLTGDSWWLDVENIVSAILKPRSKPGQMRRFYYNQVVAAEDAWVHGEAVSAAIDPMAAAYRRENNADQLRAGWALVGPEEPIVMFFDGSKSQDSTGLVGCRLSDGYTFTIGVWQQPKGNRGKTWLAPRALVDERVSEAHGRFKIVAFLADPSHALDDDDDTRYWDDMIDDWHRRYHERYLYWAVRGGQNQHSVMWDMTSPMHQEAFVKAAERFVGELETENDVEEYAPSFKIDGHPALVRHLRNARAYAHPKGYGVSLHKGSRTSTRKIDLAVCAVGARMLRRLVLNKPKEKEEEERTGYVWGTRR